MAHIRTKAELDALTLTPAEVLLIAACQKGEYCELGNGSLPTKGTPAPQRHIRASVLRYLILGGCDDCRTDDVGVWVSGAHVTETLDLDFTTTRGAIRMLNSRFEQRFGCEQTKCRQLDLVGSDLQGMRAQSLEVTGNVFLKGITTHATIDLNSATIGGQLSCSDAKFKMTTGDALNAQGVKVTASVFLKNITTHATIAVNSASIGGQLDCSDAKFEMTEGDAFFAQGAKITASVFLKNITTHATIDLNGATIGGQLSCTDAKFEMTKGDALNAQGAKVTASIFLKNITTHATIAVNSASIGGQLDCSDAKFEMTEGVALNAQGAKVNGALIWRNITISTGSLVFNSAHFGVLADDEKSWPNKAIIEFDGMTYDRIVGSSMDAKTRLQWLKKASGLRKEFQPQPYTQLAKVLRDMGHDKDARLVLEKREELLKKDERKRLRTPPDPTDRNYVTAILYDIAALLHLVFADKMLKLLVGYGHRPFNSLWALIILIAITIIPAHYAWEEGSFAPNSAVIQNSENWQTIEQSEDHPSHVWSGETAPHDWTPPIETAKWAHHAPGRDWETFNRYAYGLDVVIPIINFGQTEAWAPSTNRGWWGKQLYWARWALGAMGWIVTALGAAAITGVIRRD